MQTVVLLHLLLHWPVFTPYLQCPLCNRPTQPQQTRHPTIKHVQQHLISSLLRGNIYCTPLLYLSAQNRKPCLLFLKRLHTFTSHQAKENFLISCICVHLHSTVSIPARWFRCFLHNLISTIALPSQIQYITRCCRKGFAGYRGYNGSRVSCARRRSKVTVDYPKAVGNMHQRKQTDTKDWQINKNRNNNQFPGVSPLLPHAEWLTPPPPPNSAESTKGPDFPAPGKVTLSCLGRFIRLFRSTLHLAPDLRPICLGRPYKELLPPTTQFPGSQGHINPSLYMQTTTLYRGITNKNDNKIADKVWWMHSQGARTVPLGQGGQFVHPEGVNSS